MNKTSSPKRTKKKIKSLYIHIPFCHHLCHYCDFPKMLYDEKMAFSYVEELLRELATYQIDKIETIYLGGGTPSSLNIQLLTKLLERITPLLKKGGEFTIEINSENTNVEKLLLFKRFKVNRLSIGVQSTDTSILKSLNRQHTFSDVQNLVFKAREIGFQSINLDLIYGVPNQDINHLKTDLENLLSLEPEHISIYSLTVHPGTIFFLKGISEQNQDDSRDHYDLILKQLREAGYQRYEVSNFAKPGFASRHNLTYWHNQEYYGIGLGASGYVKGVRYDNTHSLTTYLKGQYRNSQENISLIEEEKYFWILNLRLEAGFAISDYVARFGETFLAQRENTLSDAFSNNLMLKSKDRIKMTDNGLMVLDRILLEII